ncbi:hypothetical protein FRC04_001895, partial [Tulasnella sp. 424]
MEGRAHIILRGRNQSNAEQIIASLPQGSRLKYEFIQCDVSLIKTVITSIRDGTRPMDIEGVQ